MIPPKTPWWHFWNPGSGGAGGCLFGLAVFFVVPLLSWLWLQWVKLLFG